MKKAVKRGKSKSSSKRAAAKSKTKKSKAKKTTKRRPHENRQNQSLPKHDRNSRMWRRRQLPRPSSRPDWPLSIPLLAH